MTKLQFAAASLLVGGTALLVVSQHRSQTALRAQNERLHQELAQLGSENDRLSNRLASLRKAPVPRLPTPPREGMAASDAKAPAATNLIAYMVHGGEAPRLKAAQLQRYLDDNHRSAASLLSAYRASDDPAFLKEAMEEYPGDPQVAFEALLRQEATPAERREWLETFKKTAPENALAEYLSALEHFKSGQTGQAVQDLMAAAGRPGFTDYTVERIQTDAEAYRAAGYSEADAKMAATWGVALPHLREMRTLAQNMVDLAGSYRQAGDESAAQAALQMAIGLGQQMDAPSGGCVPLVTRMTGIAIEQMALKAMDPATQYGGGSVQEQLGQLAQRKDSLKDLVKQSTPFQEQMTSEDWLIYNERTLSFGEENAIGWLLNRYRPQ